MSLSHPAWPYPEGLQSFLSWYCSDDARFFNTLISGLLPPILLTLWEVRPRPGARGIIHHEVILVFYLFITIIEPRGVHMVNYC